MKIFRPFILLLLLLPNVKGESKSLGDWATFHREADNLSRSAKHEEAVSLYRQVIKGRLPYQGNQHRDVGVTWNNLGVALYFLGENEQAEDAYKKIRLGASLVQIYTSLIFNGPNIVRQLNTGLLELLERDGFNHIDQAVGVDNPLTIDY